MPFVKVGEVVLNTKQVVSVDRVAALAGMVIVTTSAVESGTDDNGQPTVNAVQYKFTSEEAAAVWTYFSEFRADLLAWHAGILADKACVVTERDTKRDACSLGDHPFDSVAILADGSTFCAFCATEVSPPTPVALRG